jgi:hypothetical protein
MNPLSSALAASKTISGSIRSKCFLKDRTKDILRPGWFYYFYEFEVVANVAIFEFAFVI